MQKIRKNQWTVSEIFIDRRTNGQTDRQGWLHRTPSDKPGSNYKHGNQWQAKNIFTIILLIWLNFDLIKFLLISCHFLILILQLFYLYFLLPNSNTKRRYRFYHRELNVKSSTLTDKEEVSLFERSLMLLPSNWYWVTITVFY